MKITILGGISMKITVIANDGTIINDINIIYENKEDSAILVGNIDTTAEECDFYVYKGKNTESVMNYVRNLIINADYLGRDNVLINLYDFDNRENERENNNGKDIVIW